MKQKTESETDKNNDIDKDYASYDVFEGYCQPCTRERNWKKGEKDFGQDSTISVEQQKRFSWNNREHLMKLAYLC